LPAAQGISALIPRLLDRGYEVDVIDLLWFGNNLPREAHIIAKDIFKLSESDLKNYEQVIFLAGLSNDPMAEFSPAKKFISNAAAPSYLAYLAKRAGARRFIYAGSCSVYGYTVNELYDETSPAVSHYPYGISKLQGEQAAMYLGDDKFSVICFRQGTVCGYSPRRNFIETMLAVAKEKKEVRVVQDEVLTPTYIYHLAHQVRDLVRTRAYGLYHVTNNGSCSWYEFACAIFNYAGVAVNVVPTTVKEFMSPIKRPHYSVLENAGLQSLRIDHLPDWQTSLKHFLDHKPPAP
jgi:dTDP-4-dehydrorhamnose reductase